MSSDFIGAKASQTVPSMGVRAAVVYALVAHRLSMFYDNGYWMTSAQGATLCSEWLLEAGHNISLAERKFLSEVSDQVATQIKTTLTRQAGLYMAHELMESLDPRYVSEIGATVMDECVEVLKGAM